jgi:predicted N-acetyltransferase YhbS
MAADEQAGWHARLYREGDEEGIVALYNRVFSYDRTPDWWRWKIKGRPAPHELTWVAVSDADGSIVGHYAGISSQMKLGDTVRPCIVNVDAMTAPEFRKRGILLALGEAANEHWRALGYAAVVGLPNEQWGSRLRILGWQTLFPLDWLRFPLHMGRPLAKRAPRPLRGPAYVAGEAASRLLTRRRVGSLTRKAGVQIAGLRAAGEEIDALWSALEPHYPNCLVRDAAYVRWRFLHALPEPYRVLLARAGGTPTGYIAYRAWAPRGGNNAYIADLFTAPNDQETARALLGAALNDLWQRQISIVSVTAVPGSALYAHLTGAGFRAVGVGFGYDLVPLGKGLDTSALSDPKIWLASGSDSDVV